MAAATSGWDDESHHEPPFDIDGIDPEPGDTLSDQEFQVTMELSEHAGAEVAHVFAHGEAYLGELSKAMRKVLLAVVTQREIVIHPLISASYRNDFLEPKHGEVTTIRVPARREGFAVPEDVETFEALLEDTLPKALSRLPRRGLGFRWDYRLIPEAIASSTEATEISIVDGDVASLAGNTFTLGSDRINLARKGLDAVMRRAQRRSLEDRRFLAYNEILHSADATRFPRRQRQAQPGEILEVIQHTARDSRRNTADRQAAAQLVANDAQQMARDDPATLMQLRSEIERVTLGELIERFERLMARNPTEDRWQEFFEANPFVLGVAFPHPVVLIRGQAHVGGTKLDGRGESIADFLFAQRLTGGIAIFEIKTTTTPLLEARAFRGDLYGPNKVLCAAMAQALDQRSELIMNFHAKARDLEAQDGHVGHVHCLVIAGMAPDTPARKRSLDLFRNAAKDVAVVTFDELLEKLKSIHHLMGGAGATAVPASGAATPAAAPAATGAPGRAGQP